MDLAKQAKIVDSIHDTLHDFVGQRLKVRANMGRSKIVENEGVLTQVHPQLFIMEVDRKRGRTAPRCRRRAGGRRVQRSRRGEGPLLVATGCLGGARRGTPSSVPCLSFPLFHLHCESRQRIALSLVCRDRVDASPLLARLLCAVPACLLPASCCGGALPFVSNRAGENRLPGKATKPLRARRGRTASAVATLLRAQRFSHTSCARSPIFAPLRFSSLEASSAPASSNSASSSLRLCTPIFA